MKDWRDGILGLTAHTLVSCFMAASFFQTAPGQDIRPEITAAPTFHSAASAVPNIKPLTKPVPPPFTACGHTYGEGKILYKSPAYIARIIEEVTQDSPVPCEMLFNLIGSESGFRLDATSPTGVQSIIQMELATLLEQAYKHQGKLPGKQRKIVENNIERISEKRGSEIYLVYRIKDGGSEEAVRSIVNDDVRSAVILAHEYLKETYHLVKANILKALEERGASEAMLERARQEPLSASDMKACYTLGANAAHYILLIEKFFSEKRGDKALVHITGRSAKSNHPVLIAGQGLTRHPRSIGQVNHYFKERVGDTKIYIASADEQKQSEPPQQLTHLSPG
ncbi:MAG: hypothetical protein R3D66_06540 [Alphaproteobacteria bacterium]